jgi:phosphoribosylformylglycinamidine synthase subunit PurL
VAPASLRMMASPPPGGGAPPWIGAAVRVPFGQRKDFVLFGEEPSRILVSLSHEGLPRLEAIARECGAPLLQLGAVGGDRLEIQGALSAAVSDLAAAWRDGLPKVLRREARHRSS